MFSKEELRLMLEWYKYVAMNEDVPIYQANIDLAYKIQELISSNLGLTMEKCLNIECFFQHEGYCSLEKIDLADDNIALHISFDCPKIKIEV